jgi:hypothetical protein
MQAPSEGSGPLRNLHFVIVTTLGFSALASPQHAGAKDAPLRITVRFYNYARASHRTLRKAQIRASYILREAGIETTWLDCPVTASRLAHQQACPSASSADHIFVRIVHRPRANGEFSDSSVGYALTSDRYGWPVYATVFLDRIEGIANGWVSPSVILGYGIAHEIGHLLLGNNSHSETGIMTAHWAAENLQSARHGGLTFTPDQARQIQANVEARLEKQKPETYFSQLQK